MTDATAWEDLGYGEPPDLADEDPDAADIGRPERPTAEDEAWRDHVLSERPRRPPSRDMAGLVAEFLEAADAIAPKSATAAAGARLRCLRCNTEVAVLMQPRGHAERTICGACSGKEWRKVTDEIGNACAAYKANHPTAHGWLVDLLGKADADEWCAAVDNRRGAR